MQPLTIEEITRMEDELYQEINEFMKFLTGSSTKSVTATSNKLIAAHQKLLAQQAAIADNPVDIATETAENLESEIEASEVLASKLNSGVRKLNNTLTNTASALNHVQALIKLNESIVGVQKAIQNEDFAAAARYMNWYYEIGDKLPIRDEDKKTMKNAEVELLQIMESKLEESIQKHHTEDVLTYSVLFETYGRGKEGLDRFINYITSEFSSQCKGFIDELALTIQKDPSTSLYWDHLSTILQMCSDNLLQYVSIKDKFKSVSDAYPQLIKNIYIICDKYISIILDYYIKGKNLNTLLNHLKNNMTEKKYLTIHTNDDITRITDEIALLSQHIENYHRYMVAEEDQYCNIINQNNNNNNNNNSQSSSVKSTPIKTISKSTTSQQQQQQTISSSSSYLPSDTPGNKKLTELLHHYVFLEDVIITRGIVKANEIDSLDKEYRITSFVDNIFYIIQCSVLKAINQGDIQCFKDIMTVVIEHFTHDIYNIMSDRISQILDNRRVTLNLDYAPIVIEVTLKSLPVTLNDIEMILKNIRKFIKRIEDESNGVYDNDEDNKECEEYCGKLGNLEELYQKLLDKGFQGLLHSIESKLKSSLDSTLNNCSFTPDDMQYQKYLNTSPIQEFINTIGPEMLLYINSLSQSNFHFFLPLLISYMSSTIENIIMKKKFNHLGGLFIDKEIRALVSYFTSISSPIIRSNFSRITQIISFLSIERLDEAVDIWREGHSTVSWKLSDSYIHKILLLRNDFDPKKVDSLHFN